MGICPNCKKEIDELKIFTLEENEQSVSLPDDGELDWGAKEPVEASAKWTEAECPECCKTLLHMKGDGDFDEIKKLLKNKDSEQETLFLERH